MENKYDLYSGHSLRRNEVKEEVNFRKVNIVQQYIRGVWLSKGECNSFTL